MSELNLNENQQYLAQKYLQQFQEEKAVEADVEKAPEKFGTADFDFGFESKQEIEEDLILRKERSQAYLDIVYSIDMLSSTDEEIIEKLKEVVDEEIIEEYQEMSVDEMMEELRLCFEEEIASKELKLQTLKKPIQLLGVYSKCYIKGCDIHAIDKKGTILAHYEAKTNYSKYVDIARKYYYKNPNCKCIEIYSNAVCVVAQDGTVKTIYEKIEEFR